MQRGPNPLSFKNPNRKPIMNILTKPEQTFTPVNQPHPDQFPRFYKIPETKYIRRRQRASNAPQYYQPPSPTPVSPRTEPAFRKAARIEVEIFQEFCQDTWNTIKELGRAFTHWLVRWVITPLAISSSLFIPSIHPMELFPI
jgi:hypothetical protein